MRLYFITFDLTTQPYTDNQKTESRLETFTREQRQDWIDRYNQLKPKMNDVHYSNLKVGCVRDMTDHMLSNDDMQKVIDAI